MIQGVESGDRAAARSPLSALTSPRLFDRILTLELAPTALAAFATQEQEPETGSEDEQ